jgi:hypothetical protein
VILVEIVNVSVLACLLCVSVRLIVRWFVCLIVCWFVCLCVGLSVWLCVGLSVWYCVGLSVWLCVVCWFVCLIVRWFVCLIVRWFVCLCVGLSSCLWTSYTLVKMLLTKESAEQTETSANPSIFLSMCTPSLQRRFGTFFSYLGVVLYYALCGELIFLPSFALYLDCFTQCSYISYLAFYLWHFTTGYCVSPSVVNVGIILIHTVSGILTPFAWKWEWLFDYALG